MKEVLLPPALIRVSIICIHAINLTSSYMTNIYILSVFTENPYGKSLEHNVVYILNSNILPRYVSDVRITWAVYNLIGRQHCSTVSRKNCM